MSDYEVTLTGVLSNLKVRDDDGINATLTHPEVQVHVVFPAQVCDRHDDLIRPALEVTVFGDYAGESIRVADVRVAS